MIGYEITVFYNKKYGVDILGVDILGVDILRVDILGVDILRVNILGRTRRSMHFRSSEYQSNSPL